MILIRKFIKEKIPLIHEKMHEIVLSFSWKVEYKSFYLFDLRPVEKRFH